MHAAAVCVAVRVAGAVAVAAAAVAAAVVVAVAACVVALVAVGVLFRLCDALVVASYTRIVIRHGLIVCPAIVRTWVSSMGGLT